MVAASKLVGSAAWLVVVAAAIAAGSAKAQMTKFTPAATNSIILVDVVGLHNSPLGKTNDWESKHVEDYAAGKTPFPPAAQSIMFARELDPNGLHAVRREVAVIKSTEPIGFQRLAEVVGGKVQKISSRNVVASPRGFLAALLDDKSVAAYYPADRQAFGRWLKTATQSENETLSPYLTRVSASWPRVGQIMMALDMTDGLDETAIVDELKLNKEIVKNEDDARALAKAFSHIEGMRFSIAVTDKINAEWTVDFTESMTGMEKTLRPFFESAVKRMSRTNFDLSTWSMSSTPRGVSFRSTLTPEQLKSVFESIHSPILMGQTLSRTGAVDPNQAKASQEYYRSVNNIVHALDRYADRMTDYNAAAVEYDRSANRIQRLSTENVDPECVQFANTVANMLFGMSSTLRGVPREAAVQTAGAWNQRFFRGPSYYDAGWTYPWRWGVTSPVVVNAGPNPVDAARQTVARSMADESAQRRDEWLKIRELQRATDARMTNKYGVDFMPKK